MEQQILNYDRDWEEIKQAVMPKDMSDDQKENLLDLVIVQAIITNT